MDRFESDALSLFDRAGRRKYLAEGELVRFLRACRKLDAETRLFCLVLALTGCRVSEALALTPQQLDAGLVAIIFRTLKRRKLVFRAVPVPAKLMRELVALTWSMERAARIWSWSRPTAWRRIKLVMERAGIVGIQASPKGLRHSFGVNTFEQKVPLSLARQWMGHSRLESTLVYQQMVGAEQRRYAQRLWHSYARL